ncbi:unnamed protein product [Vitrella brassicaformis CCMP3155]|uniref:subtilisin n=3 Tax=Vitrella brassicaformis TaxID=1169539 RepID=A0A0G4GJU3_VITBC|nr:unnamed protein product [Vitrella brassicaformis CCMP3155]|eukprot:CEM30221.1 unnamed protein product [Vitrella brassicaformis CCMP3155]
MCLQSGHSSSSPVDSPTLLLTYRDDAGRPSALRRLVSDSAFDGVVSTEWLPILGVEIVTLNHTANVEAVIAKLSQHSNVEHVQPSRPFQSHIIAAPLPTLSRRRLEEREEGRRRGGGQREAMDRLQERRHRHGRGADGVDGGGGGGVYGAVNDPNVTVFDGWWLERLRMEEAWGYSKSLVGETVDLGNDTDSDPILVAVVDTGVNYRHPDLSGMMWNNPKEIPDNGIDDDENGYVDDIYGYDFFNGRSDPLTHNAHGTHIAGLIAAKANNSIGIAGVCGFCRRVKLVAVKVFDDRGYGKGDKLAKGWEYIAKMGVRLSTASFGWRGAGPFDNKLLRKMVQRLGDRGHLIVTSAGNENLENESMDSDGRITSNDFPCAWELPNILCVAATTPSDELVGFSNIGKRSTDIAAPGHELLSTAYDNAYMWISGTSMAAPVAAGAAALLMDTMPHLNAKQVKDALTRSADYAPSLLGKVLTNGRLNAYRALKHAYENDECRIISMSGWPFRLHALDRPFTRTPTGTYTANLTLAAAATAAARKSGNMRGGNSRGDAADSGGGDGGSVVLELAMDADSGLWSISGHPDVVVLATAVPKVPGGDPVGVENVPDLSSNASSPSRWRPRDKSNTDAAKKKREQPGAATRPTPGKWRFTAAPLTPKAQQEQPPEGEDMEITVSCGLSPTCSFEDGWCGWHEQGEGEGEGGGAWRRVWGFASGGDKARNDNEPKMRVMKMPNVDHTMGTAQGVYASIQMPLDDSQPPSFLPLVSPPLTHSPLCIHMVVSSGLGRMADSYTTVPSLSVSLMKGDANGTALWSGVVLEGAMGGWKEVMVNVDVEKGEEGGPYWLQLEAFVHKGAAVGKDGSGIKSSTSLPAWVAIDDVQASLSACRPPSLLSLTPSPPYLDHASPYWTLSGGGSNATFYTNGRGELVWRDGRWEVRQRGDDGLSPVIRGIVESLTGSTDMPALNSSRAATLARSRPSPRALVLPPVVSPWTLLATQRANESTAEVFVTPAFPDHEQQQESISCDFESGLCGYVQDGGDDMEWSIGTKGVGSQLAGPTGDASLAEVWGRFAFVETSLMWPAKGGSRARLISPTHKPNSHRHANQDGCLEFRYHAKGATVGDLHVYLINATQSHLPPPAWSFRERDGRLADHWKTARVAVALDDSFRVVFEAVMAEGWLGDVGIDDVNLSEEPCPVSIECSFEGSLCGFTNTPTDTDRGAWSLGPRYRTLEDSHAIIPLNDHTSRPLTSPLSPMSPTSTRGEYLFTWVEEKAAHKDKKQKNTTRVVVSSPVLIPDGRGGGVDGDGVEYCVEFWYWIRGGGGLRVEKNEGGVMSGLWEVEGVDQGDTWQVARTRMAAFEPFSIVWMAIKRPEQSKNDIAVAIDDVTITPVASDAPSPCTPCPFLAVSGFPAPFRSLNGMWHASEPHALWPSFSRAIPKAVNDTLSEDEHHEGDGKWSDEASIHLEESGKERGPLLPPLEELLANLESVAMYYSDTRQQWVVEGDRRVYASVKTVSNTPPSAVWTLHWLQTDTIDDSPSQEAVLKELGRNDDPSPPHPPPRAYTQEAHTERGSGRAPVSIWCSSVNHCPLIGNGGPLSPLPPLPSHNHNLSSAYTSCPECVTEAGGGTRLCRCDAGQSYHVDDGMCVDWEVGGDKVDMYVEGGGERAHALGGANESVGGPPDGLGDVR